jgi:hypothetical protein
LVVSVVLAAAAGCGGVGSLNNNGGGGTGTRSGGNVGGNATSSDTGTGTGGAANSGTTTTTTSGTTTISDNSGLPCDIAAILSSYCTSCHGSPPTAGAPMSLLTYAELTATKNGQSYAAISLARMQSTSAPMPPGGGVSAAELAAWQAWVSAGTPMGSCGGVDAGPPDTTFTDPASHTCDGSMTNHTCNGSQRMNPGEACISCHNSNACGGENGPFFSLAGTVFARGHVPDDCRTSQTTVDLTQAQVIITDANGGTHTLSVNSAGNFSSQSTIAKPYHAKVVYQGRTRAMAAAQTDGDCNTCHTENGTNGAPGRVALPAP